MASILDLINGGGGQALQPGTSLSTLVQGGQMQPDQRLQPAQPQQMPQVQQAQPNGAIQQPEQFQAPASEEELVQRKKGWQGFLDTLRNDKGLQQALLRAGGELIAGPRRGESTGSAIGRALQTGVLTKAQADQRAGQQALLNRREDRDDVRLNADLESQDIVNRGRTQDIDFAAERQPLALQQDRNQLSKQEFELSNQDLLLQDQLSNSAAGRTLSAAQARRANALAANAGKGGSQRAPTNQEFRQQLFRDAYPHLTPQELSLKMLDFEKQGGSDSTNTEIRALGSLIENGDPRDPLVEQARERFSALTQLNGGSEGSTGGEASTSTSDDREKAFHEAAKKAGPDGVFTFEGQRWKLR